MIVTKVVADVGCGGNYEGRVTIVFGGSSKDESGVILIRFQKLAKP